MQHQTYYSVIAVLLGTQLTRLTGSH